MPLRYLKTEEGKVTYAMGLVGGTSGYLIGKGLAGVPVLFNEFLVFLVTFALAFLLGLEVYYGKRR